MDSWGANNDRDYLGSLFPRPSRTTITAAAAILLHAILLIFGKFPTPPKTEPAPIEISSLGNLGQIVQTRRAGREIEDPKAKFAGERNQQVEKERRARLGDNFQSAARRTERRSESVDWRKLTLGDLGIHAGKYQPEETGDGRAAFSSSDDYIKNVPMGADTALSTREFKFYAYYQRIRDEVKQRWLPEVRARFQELATHTNLRDRGALITSLVVTLDEQGKVESIRLLSSSGFQEIDAAADYAFRTAGAFQNPPSGLLDSDRRVRFKWDFVIEMNGPRIGVGLFQP